MRCYIRASSELRFGGFFGRPIILHVYPEIWIGNIESVAENGTRLRITWGTIVATSVRDWPSDSRRRMSVSSSGPVSWEEMASSKVSLSELRDCNLASSSLRCALEMRGVVGYKHSAPTTWHSLHGLVPLPLHYVAKQR